jgi:hypothetical protein
MQQPEQHAAGSNPHRKRGRSDAPGSSGGQPSNAGWVDRTEHVKKPAAGTSDRVASESKLPPYVLISCFDECDRYVEVSTALLEEFNCRLYGVVKYQPASYDPVTKRPFWRSGMTRAMLQTFVRSLTHGELSLAKNVSITEAMTTLEYENVPIGVPSARKAEITLLRSPPTGAVFQKRAERVAERMLSLCEQVSHAICRWPRLECTLDSAFSGQAVQCSSSPTRVWVRITKKPQRFAERGDLCTILAQKWPYWVASSLCTFGIIHDRLVAEKKITTSARDEASFSALESRIMGDQLGNFLFAAYDWPRHNMDRATRREHAAGERFAMELKNLILDVRPGGPGAGGGAGEVGGSSSAGALGNAGASTSSGTCGSALQYARACFMIADKLANDTPSLSQAFSASCVDDNGKTHERTQLGRSLWQRGIKIVRWASGDDAPSTPLVFPSQWADCGQASAGCCVLLDFSERR